MARAPRSAGPGFSLDAQACSGPVTSFQLTPYGQPNNCAERLPQGHRRSRPIWGAPLRRPLVSESPWPLPRQPKDRFACIARARRAAPRTVGPRWPIPASPLMLQPAPSRSGAGEPYPPRCLARREPWGAAAQPQRCERPCCAWDAAGPNSNRAGTPDALRGPARRAISEARQSRDSQTS